MSWVNLSTITNWVSVVSKLPSLVSLDLSFCELRTCPDSLLHSNLTSLETLKISDNNFNKHIAPNWFGGLTSLKSLDASGGKFYGQFPYEIGNMTAMVSLDLSSNNITGMIPSNLKNLCNYEELYLMENNINGSIIEFFHGLPSCSWNKLKRLFLPLSNLTGSLPSNLEPLSNLTWHVLSDNKLEGPVPLWIGELTNLDYLDMSSNNLNGVMHEGHLSGLKRLKRLSMSDNSLAILVNSSWVSPFNLDISNTSISDMAQDWFWTVASSVYNVNIRNNQISGFLSSKMEHMTASTMDLSSNLFTGSIPKLPANLTKLDLRRNNLYGPLPLDFGAPRLSTLLLHNNSISGTFPSSLCKLRFLRLLDLSNNNLTGTIPNCLDYESNTTNNRSLSICNLSL
jgi:Leucine-rich repeat (LRR) protein